jgi:hypothetical protein
MSKTILPLNYYAEEVATYQWLQQIPPIDALAFTYKQWCRAEGYPEISMFGQDVSIMPRKDALILQHFQKLWEELSNE